MFPNLCGFEAGGGEEGMVPHEWQASVCIRCLCKQSYAHEHLPVTSAVHFHMGHGLVLGHSPGVGDIMSFWIPS